jgi:hypothetical protein
MKQYGRTLGALLILLAVWASFTYYGRRKSREAAKTESKPAEKFLPVNADQIQAFSIKPRDGKEFTCERQGKTWSIVAPDKLAADQSQVTSLLSSLTTATVDEVVDAHPSSLKDFGLDPPATTIHVSAASNPSELTVRLGDETPTGSGLYAQVEGNPRVVTLDEYLKSSLEKTEFDLRDKRAFTLDTNRIQQITVTAKGKHWTLVKNPEGTWELNLPPAVRADHYAVDGLVSQLQGLTMQSILAEQKKDAASYGLNHPTLTIQVTGADGTQSVILGKKEGDHYDAMNSALAPIFTLGSDVFTQFDKDAADLRDKDFFSQSPLNSTRIEVHTPRGRQVFEKQKDQWKQTAPGNKTEPNDKMEAFLIDLGDLRASSFPPAHSASLAAYGLAKPAYTFTVTSSDNKTETVEVGIVDDHYYARRSTDALPGEILKSTFDDLTKALASL